MYELPYRQIHLDFHTSELIPDIAECFDGRAFAETLKRAHVNSVNLFAKCHHGMYYYPTKLGRMHPNLKLDLLGEQIKACREQGIRTVVYTCVAWNEAVAYEHPEWLQLSPEGILGEYPPFTDRYNTWHRLCINNRAYQELIMAELKELYERYRPDGFWIDIVNSVRCVCNTCRTEMKRLGLNPQNEADLAKHDRMNEIAYSKRIYSYLKEMDEKLTVYFNQVPYEPDLNDDTNLSASNKRKYQSYIDIESLPSETWGYTHFPIVANFLNKYRQEITMMNGKFLTEWGDFNSLRNQEALEYECFRAVANGAKICIGDQMHPCGRLDNATYELIGSIFGRIEQLEPWLKATGKVAEAGVFVPSRVCELSNGAVNNAMEGAYRILTELHIPFDFINYTDDYSRYELLVLPDNVPLDDAVAERIDAFVEAGGALLVTGTSALSASGDFMLKSVPVEYVSESAYKTRYIRFVSEGFEAIPKTDHVLYQKGITVRAKEGAKVPAEIVNPYFDRNNEHFCSHRQTPPMQESGREPAIVKRGRVVYINSPLFTDYCMNGYRVHKQTVKACFDMLTDKPLIRAELPTLTEVTLRTHPEGLMVHFLSYSISRKCKRMDIIEDAVTVTDATVEIRTGFEPEAVRTVPELREIPFTYENDYVSFHIDKMTGYELIQIVKG